MKRTMMLVLLTVLLIVQCKRTNMLDPKFWHPDGEAPLVYGTNWRFSGFLPDGIGFRYNHASVVFNGRLWVIGGDKVVGGTVRTNDVWSTADGTNWTLDATGPFPQRALHSVVVHAGKLFIIGGQLTGGIPANDVWSSADGRNWTGVTAAFPARSEHAVFAANGTLFVTGGTVAGGNTNDLWSSADGSIWQYISSGAFTRRSGAKPAMLGSSVFLIDGLVLSQPSDETIRSVDGRTWSVLANVSVHPYRRFHAVVSGRDRFIVIGGHDGINPYADAWYQKGDGIWKRASDDIGISLFRMTATIFSGRIWVIGGLTGLGLATNTVYIAD